MLSTPPTTMWLTNLSQFVPTPSTRGHSGQAIPEMMEYAVVWYGHQSQYLTAPQMKPMRSDIGDGQDASSHRQLTSSTLLHPVMLMPSFSFTAMTSSTASSPISLLRHRTGSAYTASHLGETWPLYQSQESPLALFGNHTIVFTLEAGPRSYK
jgi:hypothetical protein